uniref:Uncharacterized protein n=1 Tax=viral metagenome TaxID=1070528 RepID=A0A2V0RN47_9ZZZZ
MGIETVIIGTVIATAKLAKGAAIASKRAGYKVCGRKSTALLREGCRKKLTHDLATGHAHVITQEARGKVHEVGQQLVTGHTPIGQGLEGINGTPQHLLGPKGITNTELFHFAENVEKIHIVDHDVGWWEMIIHLFDAASELPLDVMFLLSNFTDISHLIFAQIYGIY